MQIKNKIKQVMKMRVILGTTEMQRMEIDDWVEIDEKGLSRGNNSRQRDQPGQELGDRNEHDSLEGKEYGYLVRGPEKKVRGVPS